MKPPIVLLFQDIRRILNELLDPTKAIVTLIVFPQGNRLKRSTLALFGAGTTKIEVQYIFQDVSTGKPVLSLKTKGTGSGGLVAGGDDKDNQSQAMLRSVNR